GRAIEQNGVSTRSIEGGMPLPVVDGTLSILRNLDKFRAGDHHQQGEHGCQREKQLRPGKADSRAEKEASKARVAESPVSTISARASRAASARIRRNSWRRLKRRVSAWRSAQDWRRMELRRRK